MNSKKYFSSLLAFSLALVLFLSFSLVPKAYEASEEEVNEESTEMSKEKVVYLTFDDGPGGKTTISVLDTLKKENVPATFFVIGEQIKGQEDLILRMKDEGHSIGLHSFSHNRGKLYSGNEGFLKEMLEDQKTIYDVTGENYTILRFPFGCNNSTYRLTQSLVDLLHENNMKIYDWTTDSGDGANPYSDPGQIVTKACKHKDCETVIVLMHCSYINKSTASALPGIIKHYKNKGYTFKAITNETPEVYKIIKN